MDEATIRAVLAHIAAVRDRWGSEVERFWGGQWLDIDLDIQDDSLSFIYTIEGEQWGGSIPMLAFVDFDAAKASRAGDD